MAKVKLLLLLVLSSFFAHTANADSLGLNLDFVSDTCPFTYNEIHSQLEGEFLRARLKPDTLSTGLNLWVTVQCIELRSGTSHTGYAASTTIMYSISEDHDSMLFTENYGGMTTAGTGGQSKLFLMNNIAGMVSSSLDVFLRQLVD